MAHHILKAHPQFFDAVMDLSKTFEIRKNDRNFKAGDTAVLQHYDPETGSYNGKELYISIPYVMLGGKFGLDADYCIFSISEVEYREVKRNGA
jgi:hypothetical protein